MHISFEDPETGDTCTLCIDRSSKKATLIRHDLSMIEQAVGMARSLGASKVEVIAARGALEELQQFLPGWTVDETRVVLTRKV
jgi:hypothetical protein